MEKLNKVDWAVYNAIKEGGVITQKELCEAVNARLGHKALTYNAKATNCKNDQKGDHCKWLLPIVQKINASPEVEKIIVIKNYCYFLGSEEQCMAYYRQLTERAIAMFKRANAVWRKIKKDGQGKLISCHGEEITEDSKARRFTEAYPNG